LRKIYSQPVTYDGPLTSDYKDYEGKPWQVMWQEQTYMAVDCLGICKYHTTFLGATLPNYEEWSELLYYNTGLKMTPLEIWTVAERANNLERLFNLREGLTRQHDWLVDRYFDEPTKIGIPALRNKSIDRDKFKNMVDQFYQYRGWDENGVPAQDTLERLEIDKEPSHML
jgi:aldehyde:ferredoxin oxidoreductase